MTLTVLKSKNIFSSFALHRFHRFKSTGTEEVVDKRSLPTVFVPSTKMQKALGLEKEMEPVSLQFSPELINRTAGLVFSYLFGQARLSQSATTGNALFDKHILQSMEKTHFGDKESARMRITSKSVRIPVVDNNEFIFFEPKDDSWTSILARLYAHGDSFYGQGNPICSSQADGATQVEHLYESPVQILLKKGVSQEQAFSYLKEVHRDLVTAQTLAVLAALPGGNPVKNLVLSPFGLANLPDFSKYPKLVEAFGGLTHERLIAGRKELSGLGFNTATEGSRIGGFLLVGPDGKPMEKTWHSILTHWTTMHYSALEEGEIESVPCLTFTLGRLRKAQMADGLVSPEKSSTGEEIIVEEQGVGTESRDQGSHQPRSTAVLGSTSTRLLTGEEAPVQPMEQAKAEEVAQMPVDQEGLPENLLQKIYEALITKDPAIPPSEVIAELERFSNQDLPAVEYYRLLLRGKELMQSTNQEDLTEALNLLEQASQVNYSDEALLHTILKGEIFNLQEEFGKALELLDPYVTKHLNNPVLQHLYLMASVNQFEMKRKGADIKSSDPIFAQIEAAIERVKKIIKGGKYPFFPMEISFPVELRKSMIFYEGQVLRERIDLMLKERKIEEAILLVKKMIELANKASRKKDKTEPSGRISDKEVIVDDLVTFIFGIYLIKKGDREILDQLNFRTWCEEQLKVRPERFVDSYRQLQDDMGQKLQRGELNAGEVKRLLAPLNKIIEETITRFKQERVLGIGKVEKQLSDLMQGKKERKEKKK